MDDQTKPQRNVSMRETQQKHNNREESLNMEMVREGKNIHPDSGLYFKYIKTMGAAAAKGEKTEEESMEEGTSGSTTPSNSKKQLMLTTKSKRLNSNMDSGMENSVFRFKDVNFVVGNKKKQKHILTDVSDKIKSGHVLAVMGPSGAGKTTLINALTLDAFYGKPYGDITLNGVHMTDKIFKRHAFVVKQQDKHWPYLTARETMTFAAQLYEVAEKNDIDEIVGDVITSMGLDSCADTRCARLSGGQRRRLSIAVALLKQPTLLFLDEPTSGLDAAAAQNIMQEIRRVAKEEKLIIVCTIHQPSTKVYNGFDEVMILSKGREAFTGNVVDAAPYFDEIGYPLPPATNPAEHFLDLVNADFSNDEEIDHILDSWEEKKPDVISSIHGNAVGEDENEGIVDAPGTNLCNEMRIMFRRHFQLVVRDPILYLGRAVIFLIANTIFALVYLKARPYDQDQAANKMWLSIWFIAVPSNMGVVAVYALNDEFKSIQGEVKNGMVKPLSYMLAKTVLVLPIMIIFALFALGIPGYAIQDYPPESFGTVVLLWATVMFVFECLAEALAVWFDDPIMGMLNFMNFWFASFLFAGFLIPFRDMYWPFKLFYYIMPYQYYVRSVIFAIFRDASWSDCDPETNNGQSPVCVEGTGPNGETTGYDVLGGLGVIYPLIEPENNLARDFGIMVVIAMCYKILYVVGIMYKTSRVAVPKTSK